MYGKGRGIRTPISGFGDRRPPVERYPRKQGGEIPPSNHLDNLLAMPEAV